MPCRIVDSSGTTLPDAGTAVVVGVSDERILVWDVARVPTQTGKLLGVVGRSRLLRAEVERAGARTRVRFGFEERFTVGDPGAVIDQVGALVDAGLDELIFNLPYADAPTVRRAGELLVSRFG